MKRIYSYWYSQKLLGIGEKTNFGDEIGPFLIERISGTKPTWVNIKSRRLIPFFSKNVLCTVGSIIEHLDRNCTIWGSGIISKEACFPQGDYIAVRGDYTRRLLKESKGIDCKVMGDPALLIPKYINASSEKRYKYGIIPHLIHEENMASYGMFSEDVKIISLNRAVEDVVKDITMCDYIYSSSLHGLIVAHSYGIPALKINFSQGLFGDGIKFYDYFSSVGIENYDGYNIHSKGEMLDLFHSTKLFLYHQPEKEITRIGDDLLNCFPY